MPADEVTCEADTDGSRARTGPRHAAPRKPLFNGFHMPGGKAIASVAMPTAVIVGLGFTSSLALADNGGDRSPSTTSKNQMADEYNNCVNTLDGTDGSSPAPSPSASSGTKPVDTATTRPPATAGAKDTETAETAKDTGKASSPDPGRPGGKAAPAPTATAGSSGAGSGSSGSGSADTTATPTPTPSASHSSDGGNLLQTIGDALGSLLTGGDRHSDTAATTPTPSASPSAGAAEGPTPDLVAKAGTSTPSAASASPSGSRAAGTAGSTTAQAGKTATDTGKNTPSKVSSKAADTVSVAQPVTQSPSASASASPSASPSDCPIATDDVSGVDNKVAVADDPWYLNASSLLLKGADYQGIVEVKTANGTKKRVLKYVISGGTDIGDLHQTVQDKQVNKTYHVQAAKGSTSTIRDGDTVMYTESISGNLFGLIPVTFSPDSPPPLNIPLIYFTHVKVVQAAQFGGTLHIPGMHVYTTD
ncbi:hypothetical protein [Streptomyces pluripotens]|nr:hypothetical protein [Streptomyces pluripotens]